MQYDAAAGKFMSYLETECLRGVHAIYPLNGWGSCRPFNAERSLSVGPWASQSQVAGQPKVAHELERTRAHN